MSHIWYCAMIMPSILALAYFGSMTNRHNPICIVLLKVARASALLAWYMSLLLVVYPKNFAIVK